MVLAADVLYEKRDIEPMLDLIEWLVEPGGLFWLAEPGRNVAERFNERATERGWTDSMTFHAGPWPDPRDFNVSVTVHQMRARRSVDNVPGVCEVPLIARRA